MSFVCFAMKWVNGILFIGIFEDLEVSKRAHILEPIAWKKKKKKSIL